MGRRGIALPQGVIVVLNKILTKELPALLNLLNVNEPPLPYEFVDNDNVGLTHTSCGWVVRIPQDIVDDIIQVTAFYLHCLTHYILQHNTRRVRTLLKDIWDCAADYVANSLLFVALRKNHKYLRAVAPTIAKAICTLHPYRPDWEAFSVETIYHRLLTSNENTSKRFTDSHSQFVDSGMQENITPQIHKAHGQRGGTEKSLTKYKTKIAAARVPHVLLNELQKIQHYEYTEMLDLLQLSYNRIDTYWMCTHKLIALHILDVSGSMNEHLSATAAACWHTIAAVYEIWGGNAEQLVLWADVEKHQSWVGYEPDNVLLRKLSDGVGLGGTKIFSACSDELNRYSARRTLLIVYSDLQLAAEDEAFAVQWFTQHDKQFCGRIAIIPSAHTIHKIKQLFTVTVPLSAFFAHNKAK